jgi:hypothetical protein
MSKFGTFLKCSKKFLGYFFKLLGHFEVPLNLNLDGSGTWPVRHPRNKWDKISAEGKK